MEKNKAGKGIREWFAILNRGHICTCECFEILNKGFIKNYHLSWVWWYIPVISVLGRQRQEEHEFKVSLRYITGLRPA
jgi:hypothetical protein